TPVTHSFPTRRSSDLADRMLRLTVGGKVAFERIDSFPEDEVLRRINLLGHAHDFVANRGVLQFEIEKRNGHRPRSLARSAFGVRSEEHTSELQSLRHL